MLDWFALEFVENQNMGSDSESPRESPPPCCHAHSNYCIGQSELKGEVCE